MCRSRLWLLYWVSTQIFRMPPLARLDSAKSISRYRPPNGTAGFARSAVSGLRRVPAPPASTMPRTDLLACPVLLGRVLRPQGHAPPYRSGLGRVLTGRSPDLPAQPARAAVRGVPGAGRWHSTPP